MSRLLAMLRRIGRTTLLLVLVAAATITLMRFAPGYFADEREMDAQSGQKSRSELLDQRSKQRDFRSIATSTLNGWLHGDLGGSRQYQIPVTELMRPRLLVTAKLLTQGILGGWLIALCVALPLSMARRGASLVGAPFTLLLAIPIGAMGTVCLLGNTGGPVLVLSLYLAARDFKFLLSLLRVGWRAPHLLVARAQGLRLHQLVRAHVLPNAMPQLIALVTLSLVTALSALVPVEVLFDVPGIGQLAWAAAMNRDLPVLLTITLLMALMVSLVTIFSDQAHPLEGV